MFFLYETNWSTLANYKESPFRNYKLFHQNLRTLLLNILRRLNFFIVNLSARNYYHKTCYIKTKDHKFSSIIIQTNARIISSIDVKRREKCSQHPELRDTYLSKYHIWLTIVYLSSLLFIYLFISKYDKLLQISLSKNKRPEKLQEQNNHYLTLQE